MQQKSIFLNDVQFFIDQLPDSIGLKKGYFYVYQVINKNAFQFCINSSHLEEYIYPTNNQLLSKITFQMLEKDVFFFMKNDEFIQNTLLGSKSNAFNPPQWIILFGYYFTGSTTLLCFIQYNGQEYYLIDAETGQTINKNFEKNQIELISNYVLIHLFTKDR